MVSALSFSDCYWFFSTLFKSIKSKFDLLKQYNSVSSLVDITVKNRFYSEKNSKNPKSCPFPRFDTVIFL